MNRITLALSAPLLCALAACQPAPDAPDDKPVEPQATQLRDAIQQPIDRAKAVQDTVDEAKAARDAAAEAAEAGDGG